MNIDELKQTYYEYTQKVAPGIENIVQYLRANKLEEAFDGVFNFAEGIEALAKIEQALSTEGYIINSRIDEALLAFTQVNEAMENEDITLVADIFEHELLPIFSSCSEWIFQEKK